MNIYFIEFSKKQSYITELEGSNHFVTFGEFQRVLVPPTSVTNRGNIMAKVKSVHVNAYYRSRNGKRERVTSHWRSPPRR
ncbi:hypothetical protein XNC1_3106 [Xenorhabdus nematophila ATCC 19061]|uniref:Uncharacterized protein n=1 Tax=Xenorhabdus nematophila (strain ATCC 19061 / DSM 3370 / CCUG 14189 / LMG 1036 / NCIMB 9965 / AN6) TaxID=406817 RepID=D3VKQ2_XENNA|nr:hypothetical protein XNC1_3106 [Xenorhabdus nematophila ATCC 19061]CEE91927.1 hypothetical protein XNA1_2470034 [Xenorhabdus nematophila str. Anatoliense]CEK23980.1 hypothetical protein XNC2_2986 [Xenorhabdus nematophila AN6/1]